MKDYNNLKDVDENSDSTPTNEGLSHKGISAMQGEVKPQSDWVDHGIIDVPVNNLPDPDGVNSPEDFNHHISWEDAQAATDQLPRIQNEVNAGKTGDDYSNEDTAAGLDYQNGERRFYDLYYGSDPVVLNKDGNHYDIVSGRHRIYAAKDAGLDSIPARVKERVDHREWSFQVTSHGKILYLKTIQLEKSSYLSKFYRVDADEENKELEFGTDGGAIHFWNLRIYQKNK